MVSDNIFYKNQVHQTASFGKYLFGGGLNSPGIFVGKLSPEIFVIKVK